MLKHRWTPLLVVGYCLALAYGSVTLPALPTLIALLGTGLLVTRKKTWQRLTGHALFLPLALALTAHWLPGLHGAKVIDKAVLSAGALPFTRLLNLDKPLSGFWMLLAGPLFIVRRNWKRASRLLLIVPASLIACLGGAWSLGLVTWSANWPDQVWLWLVSLVHFAGFNSPLVAGSTA
ncbi:hypothetical protein [Pseudomonas sp. BP8]|uniref:hypothetical protein n=1 Tax=Pseudomonas sp. BP8 TaxID=2817864 RepID=UPI001AE35438|nr:hypothetical protein [Pseudomonas sp. BP8]MBP2263419.1 hypothetical protein [Pseudomonas sp. BP8]HDS1736029.1 hypothetical protein [Pseudomonas putida]